MLKMLVTSVTLSGSASPTPDVYHCIERKNSYTVIKCIAVSESHFPCTVPPPHIITHPTDTSAAAPFSGVFTCSAGGYGYLSIKWERQDITLPNKINSTQVSSSEVTTSTLVIPNVNEDDVGNYHCIVHAGQTLTQSETAKLSLAGIYCSYVY